MVCTDPAYDGSALERGIFHLGECRPNCCVVAFQEDRPMGGGDVEATLYHGQRGQELTGYPIISSNLEGAARFLDNRLIVVKLVREAFPADHAQMFPSSRGHTFSFTVSTDWPVS